LSQFRVATAPVPACRGRPLCRGLVLIRAGSVSDRATHYSPLTTHPLFVPWVCSESEPRLSRSVHPTQPHGSAVDGASRIRSRNQLFLCLFCLLCLLCLFLGLFGSLGSFGSFGSLGRILLPWFRAPSILLLAGLPRRGCPARRQASWAPEALRERRGSHEGTPRGKLCLTTPLAFLDPRRHCPIQSNRGALPTASGKFGPTGRTHRKAMAFSLFVYPVRARLQPCRTSRTKLGLQPLRFVFHSRGGVHHL